MPRDGVREPNPDGLHIDYDHEGEFENQCIAVCMRAPRRCRNGAMGGSLFCNVHVRYHDRPVYVRRQWARHAMDPSYWPNGMLGEFFNKRWYQADPDLLRTKEWQFFNRYIWQCNFRRKLAPLLDEWLRAWEQGPMAWLDATEDLCVRCGVTPDDIRAFDPTTDRNTHLVTPLAKTRRRFRVPVTERLRKETIQARNDYTRAVKKQMRKVDALRKKRFEEKLARARKAERHILKGVRDERGG